MQSSTFLAFHCLAHNQITDINHVSQFANFTRRFRTLEQTFRLFIKNIKPVPSTFQTEIRANDAYISAHDFADFFCTLRNQDHFFQRACAFIVPFRNVFLESIVIDDAQTVLCSSICINDSFDKRVRGQTVSAMQTGTEHSPTAYKRLMLEQAFKSTLIPPQR